MSTATAPVVSIQVSVNNVPCVVLLGDTVWYYPNCNVQSTPQVGIVTQFHEGDMCDITLLPVNGFRSTPMQGVHLFGDERLQNPNIRKHGFWVPRPRVG